MFQSIFLLEGILVLNSDRVICNHSMFIFQVYRSLFFVARFLCSMFNFTFLKGSEASGEVAYVCIADASGMGVFGIHSSCALPRIGIRNTVFCNVLLLSLLRSL